MNWELWIKLANVAVALAALGSAIVAIITIRQLRRRSGAETYFRIEEKFYHTDLMRGLRRAAANELLSSDNTRFDAFDDLGDFFDFIGILVRRGALDVEMAHSSYYRRATAFWHIGETRHAVHKAKEGKAGRWDEFEYLVMTLEKLQEKGDKAANRPSRNGMLTEDQMKILLEQERKLPSIERWAALPEGRSTSP
jgi:hypothetical protein